jgi:uncharacterized protein (TIGR03382 family)
VKVDSKYCDCSHNDGLGSLLPLLLLLMLLLLL